MAAIIYANPTPGFTFAHHLLQQWGHIQRKKYDAVFLFEIAGMQNIRDMKLIGIFRLEFFQRGQRIVLTRLHFDGRDVVAVADLTLGDQKINFHTGGCVAARGIGIEIELMPTRSQHLRDHILHDHAHVDLQLVEQELLVDLAGNDAVFIKGMADQKTGIVHIAFQQRPVPVQIQAKGRLCGFIAMIYDHRVRKPEHGVLVFIESCALHQKSTFAIPLLPLQQFLIDFSAHKEPPDKTAQTSYLYKRITQIENLFKGTITQIKIFNFRISTQIERIGQSICPVFETLFVTFVVVKKSRHEKYLFLICFFKSRHEEYFYGSCFFKSGHGQ